MIPFIKLCMFLILLVTMLGYQNPSITFISVLNPTDAAPLVGNIGPEESYLGLRSIGSMGGEVPA
jgi:hypothetical protein